jgi:hypothetical protein
VALQDSSAMLSDAVPSPAEHAFVVSVGTWRLLRSHMQSSPRSHPDQH